MSVVLGLNLVELKSTDRAHSEQTFRASHGRQPDERSGQDCIYEPLPLSCFHEPNKRFRWFFIFAFAACYTKEPYQVQEKNHLPKSATTAEKLNHGPQLSICCVVCFSVSLFYPFHRSTLYAYDYDTHSQFMVSRRTVCYLWGFFYKISLKIWVQQITLSDLWPSWDIPSPSQLFYSDRWKKISFQF